MCWLNLGTDGSANTIQIGNTTGTATQTINVGNNSTGTNNVVIGSTSGSSTTTLQAGSNGIIINSALLRRTAGGTTTIDLVDSSNTLLAITNSNGGGVANFSVDGAGTFGTGFTLTSGNFAANGAGTFQTTTGTNTLRGDTVIDATKSLTVTSGATSLTGAATGDALTVNNSTSTGNIAVFQDNGSAVVTIADGGSVVFRNAADSATAFLVQRQDGDNIFSIDSSTPAVVLGQSSEVTGRLQFRNATNTNVERS